MVPTPEEMYIKWLGLHEGLPISKDNKEGKNAFRTNVDAFAKMYTRMSNADQGEMSHLITENSKTKGIKS